MPVWAAVMLSLKAEVTGDGTDLTEVLRRLEEAEACGELSRDWPQ